MNIPWIHLSFSRNPRCRRICPGFGILDEFYEKIVYNIR